MTADIKLLPLPDFKPENIEHDGEPSFVIGRCESCGAKIFEDDAFWADGEGVCLCHECM